MQEIISAITDLTSTKKNGPWNTSNNVNYQCTLQSNCSPNPFKSIDSNWHNFAQDYIVNYDNLYVNRI